MEVLATHPVSRADWKTHGLLFLFVYGKMVMPQILPHSSATTNTISHPPKCQLANFQGITHIYAVSGSDNNLGAACWVVHVTGSQPHYKIHMYLCGFDPT